MPPRYRRSHRQRLWLYRLLWHRRRWSPRWPVSSSSTRYPS